MTLFAIVGAALTLISLGLVGLGGYVLALRLLPAADRTGDPLALATAALLCATAQAVAIALLLGAAGQLYLPWALVLQLGLVLALLRWPRRLPPEELSGPLALVGARSWARLREHPVLAIIGLSVLGSEALRGLLRPPLSWDSLMYHLLLAASWLQSGHLQPVFGYYPISFFGFVPANGSLWLWWWMAPSHSELYVNLAFFPQTLLLALATGGMARQLGARRHWPLASFLVLLTPTVARYAATQYVDVFLAAALLAACFFGCRWLREPRAGSAALAGLGLGLAAGAKLLGPPYAALLAAALVVLARGRPLRRFAHVLLALALGAGLGSYFYLRNIAMGAGPLALPCAAGFNTPGPSAGGVVPLLPRPGSVLARGGPPGMAGKVLDAVLGYIGPRSLELGIGPPAFLLLLLVPVLPFAVPPASRREALLATIQVAGQLALWATVPFAQHDEIFANVRYLIPAVGLLLAGGVAVAESHAIPAAALQALALLLAAQGVLQLHAELPHGVRVAMAVADVAVVALAFSPALRGFLRRRAGAVAVACLALAVAGAAPLARFRSADRARALELEWAVHATAAHFYAGAWGWLDRHGGDGTVAVASEPGTYFLYPAMGLYLERRVRYVNVNRANLDNAASYPGCNPRVDASPQAWVENLRRARVRWLLLNRYPQLPFPREQQWAQAATERFALRYADATSLVYEFLPAAPPAPPAAAPPAPPAAGRPAPPAAGWPAVPAAGRPAPPVAGWPAVPSGAPGR
jgi:hypothetical protein